MMEAIIGGNLILIKEMGQEFMSTSQEKYILELGNKIPLLMELIFLKMVKVLKEQLKMENKDLGSTTTQMETSMKENGKMISKTEKEI